MRSVRTRTVRSDDRRSGRVSRRGGVGGALGAVVLALGLASPAWAGSAATATLAPIGTGSYLLTVKNISTGPVSGFFTGVQALPKAAVAPAPACKIGTNINPIEVDAALICNLTIAAGASVQVCYTGKPPGEIIPDGTSTMQLFMLGTNGDNSSILADVTLAPAVASCPLAGFSPATVTHGWKRAACSSFYKAWKKTHKHASAKQRKAEQGKLKAQHGCPLSALR